MNARRCAATLGLLAVVCVVTVEGQKREQGLVRWTAGIHETLPVRADYRALNERKRLDVALYVHNESSVKVAIDQQKLRGALSLQIQLEQRDVPINLEWQPEVLTADNPDGPVPTDLVSLVFVAPMSSGVWSLTVERADRLRFTEGKYTLRFGTVGFPAAVRTAGDEPWGGRANDARGPLVLNVTPAAGPSEVSLMHVIAARDALRRHNAPEALREYEQAVAAERNPDALAGLAGVNLSLGRYREAISSYGEVAKRNPTSQLSSEGLATAYMGIGDAVSAAGVLRKYGVPEDRVLDKLDELRHNLDRLRVR
jgi:tetratricopeptide (TPR) repeat protein